MNRAGVEADYEALDEDARCALLNVFAHPTTAGVLARHERGDLDAVVRLPREG